MSGTLAPERQEYMIRRAIQGIFHERSWSEQVEGRVPAWRLLVALLPVALGKRCSCAGSAAEPQPATVADWQC